MQFEKIFSLLDHCVDFASFAVVYKLQVNAIQQYLMSCKIYLKQNRLLGTKLTDKAEQVLSDLCMNLYELSLLLRLLSRTAYPYIALEFSQTEPHIRMKEYMASIQEDVSHIFMTKEKSPTFSFHSKSFRKDLREILTFFAHTSNKDTRIVSHANSIKQLIRQHNKSRVGRILNPPFDLLRECKEWRINSADIESESTLIMQCNSKTLYHGKLVKTNEDIYYYTCQYHQNIKTLLNRIQYEFSLLCSLRHDALFEVYKANVDSINDACIVMKYFPGESLYKKLRQAEKINGTALTTIAYSIARCIQYLHSKNIFHKAICSSSIFLDEDMNPHLWNYCHSFTSYNDTTKFLAPEYFENNTYTNRSDIYQFGLFLWELLYKQVPFSNINDSDLKTEISINKKRPVIGGYVPEGLSRLIIACWSHMPQERPSISKIIKQFESCDVYFPGTDMNLIKTKLYEIRQKRWDDKINEDDLHQAFEHPEQKDLVELLQRLISDSKLQNELSKLIEDGLIEKMTRLLSDIPDISEYSSVLISFLNSENNISRFFEAGGIYELRKLLNTKEEMRVKAAYNIIEPIIPYAFDQNALLLISIVLDDNKFDYARKIIENSGIDASELIDPCIQYIFDMAKEGNEDTTVLLQNYLKSEKSLLKFVAKTKFHELILIGDINIVRTLLSSPSFISTITFKDEIEVAKIMCNAKHDMQKQCALFVSLSFSPSYFHALSSYPKVLEDLMQIENKELVNRFIARCCRFPDACSFFLSKYISYFQDNFNDPWVLTALSRIAGFFPKKVSCLSFIPQNIGQNLKEETQLEATIRLLGVISFEKNIWNDNTSLIPTIFDLLKEKACDLLETALLLYILINVSSFIDMSEYFKPLLTMVEDMGDYSGLALLLISNLQFELQDAKIKMRLIRAICAIISIGDKYGIEGASLLIQKLACDLEMKNEFKKKSLSKIIIPVVLKLDPTEMRAFFSLMFALDKLEDEIPISIITAFDNMVLRTQLSKSISSLRESLVSRVP